MICAGVERAASIVDVVGQGWAAGKARGCEHVRMDQCFLDFWRDSFVLPVRALRAGNVH
jgi:hypothetical protein